ncbi:MAG TPA: ABC-F family ATP-binding cassette domain-containing protein, partial [Bacteroidia bacterium]
MIILQDIVYQHPDKETLFEGLNLSITRREKTGVIGNNGAGKSTLLNIIKGELKPLSGTVFTAYKPYLVSQHFSFEEHETIADVLQIKEKLMSLRSILNGNVNQELLDTLEDDWTLEERLHQALSNWGLNHCHADTLMTELSGGQRTRVLLAGIQFHHAKIVLMDEPSNHLDAEGRQLLYDFVQNTDLCLMVVSHDRNLLNLMNNITEIDKKKIQVFGGNYEFYKEQKSLERDALHQSFKDAEKALRKAKLIEKETIERRNRQDNRGKKKSEKAGMPTIAMNTLRNQAEKTTAKLKDVHEEKISDLQSKHLELGKEIRSKQNMKFDFDHSHLHKGKILFNAISVNIHFSGKELWTEPLNLTIRSGERWQIKGSNGSGKTSLLKLITGELKTEIGEIQRADFSFVYIDQTYSIVDTDLSVYELAETFNKENLEQHEIKTRLNRFLFNTSYWQKPCKVLSGGERMRLTLCCFSILGKSPDMMILDEPTNNLDVQNVEVLTEAIQSYE